MLLLRGGKQRPSDGMINASGKLKTTCRSAASCKTQVTAEGIVSSVDDSFSTQVTWATMTVSLPLLTPSSYAAWLLLPLECRDSMRVIRVYLRTLYKSSS